MSQYCKFISKANISCTGILHTEAGGIRQEDPWLTFQFSRKRMTWKGRTLFPEQPLMKMLCFSVHTLWATVQSKCMLAQGMGGGVYREDRCLCKQPPVGLIFNYMMKHLRSKADCMLQRNVAQLISLLWEEEGTKMRGQQPVEGHINVMQLKGLQCSQQ